MYNLIKKSWYVFHQVLFKRRSNKFSKIILFLFEAGFTNQEYKNQFKSCLLTDKLLALKDEFKGNFKKRLLLKELAFTLLLVEKLLKKKYE